MISASCLTLSLLAEDIAETTNDELVLRELSTHRTVHVRACAAENIYTPADVLTMLSKDSKKPVLKAVFKNSAAPFRARVMAFIRCYG